MDGHTDGLSCPSKHLVLLFALVCVHIHSHRFLAQQKYDTLRLGFLFLLYSALLLAYSKCTKRSQPVNFLIGCPKAVHSLSRFQNMYSIWHSFGFERFRLTLLNCNIVAGYILIRIHIYSGRTFICGRSSCAWYILSNVICDVVCPNQKHNTIDSWWSYRS